MPRAFGIASLFALAALLGTGCPSRGGRPAQAGASEDEPVQRLAPTAPDETTAANRPKCTDALARIESIYGAELDAALARGIFDGQRPMTRVDLYDACVTWHPWTRKCAILAESPDELRHCSPVLEPFSLGAYEDPDGAQRAAFDECVSASATKEELAACAPAPRTSETP